MSAVVAQVDLTGLNTVLRGIQNALIGMGESGDAAQLVKQTTRLLSKDIADSMPPKNLQRLKKSIAGDVSKVFAQIPAKPFPSAQRGHGDTVWLYPTTNVIVGVSRKNYRPEQTNVDTLQRMMYPRPEAISKYSDVGMHGKQHVQIINRIAIKREAYKRLVKYLQDRGGRMKASFYKTFLALDGKGIPAWIAKNIPTSRGVLDKSQLSNAESPNITFGSSAPGLNLQDAKIKGAVRKRTEAMYKRLDLILSGYAHDVATTGTVRRHAKEGESAS